MSMASALLSTVAVTPVTAVRCRLPLFGAALSIIRPSFSAPFTTGCAQSLRFGPLLRSKFGRHLQSRSTKPITTMAGSSSTVPSIVVYVTVPNKDLGKKLSGSIIREKLAACVNRVPGIESVYLWEGKIQTDNEELLIIKTRESLLDALTEHVKANHEYEVPEVIALPITGGSVPYLEWVKNSTRE